MRSELKKGEKELLTVRPHWLVMVKPFLITIFLLIITAIAYHYEQSGIIAAVCLLATLPLLINLLYQHFKRKSNVWIVTNQRVIDEWGVFSRNAKESPLNRIHNKSYTQSFIGRFFDYGDVQIQTAAGEGISEHKMITHPKLLIDTITEAKNNLSDLADDSQECPRCAEVIKLKAQVCRFCGHEFNPTDPTSPKEVIADNADPKVQADTEKTAVNTDADNANQHQEDTNENLWANLTDDPPPTDK